MEARVREIERLLNAAMRRVESLETRLAAAESWQHQMGSSLGRGPSSGGGVGSYFADPGSVVIASGGSEELTVMEVLASGPVEVGERTVYNPYPDDTEEDARLMLTRNRDGSYTVANQACAEEA